jgi:ring-1,2-phenylacetyl-CoA epoxidase subunit PaaC
MTGGWLTGKKSQYTKEEALKEYFYFLADDALILGQQLSRWCSRGPVLEQDIAIINTSLDHIGRARLLYQELAKLEGGGATEDTLAYFRDHEGFRNALLLERPNGHWGDSVVRSFFIDTFNFFLYDALRQCEHPALAGIAEKSVKEIAYHAQWSAEWVIRLGDGTQESHEKVQKSIDDLWMWTGELFEVHPVFSQLGSGFVDFSTLKTQWLDKVVHVLETATLKMPDTEAWMQTGGRLGVHTSHLGYLLAEMQSLPRTYPNASW